MFNKRLILRSARLQMFNDGGAVASTGTDGGATATESQAQPIKYESKRRQARNNSGTESGDLSNVVYGKQATAESAEPVEEAGTNDSLAKDRKDVTTTSNTLEDKKRAFEELINGEYKDIYTEKFQEVFNRRFKEAKNNEAKLGEVQPILDILMGKYNIADGDIKKLAKAIETDDTYWEEAAEAAGLTVEQYRTVQKLERENKDLRLRQQRAEGEQRANTQLSEWYRQADSVKQLYPNFDFRTELQNESFKKLLLSGLPVQHAYETMHLDELVNGAAAVAAQQAQQRTVSNVKSRASRPSENGTSSRSATVFKSDVSKFTKEDRAEIARRAARGERIEF